MSDFTKNARVTVYINGQNAATELDKLEQKVITLRKQLNKAGKDTPLGKDLKKQLRESKSELDRMRDSAGLAGMSIRQLEQESRRLRSLRNSVAPGTKAFKELDDRLKIVKARIGQVQSGLGPLGQAWQKVSFEARAAAGIFAGSLLLTKAGDTINQLGKLDDQLADVKKTSGLADEDLTKLNASLGKIKTRTSRAELRDLAYEAGKLGKDSVEDVLAFVRAADQIKIALGRDLGVDAITQIGKLSNIFKLEEQYGTEKGMLMIASAINEVGAASTATEGYIVDFLKRTSGVASIAKITAPELIGLAGTLDSLGQTSEVSSTAISKLITKMGSNITTYATLAGKSVDEFRQTMDRSGLEALLQVFENVGQTQGGLEALSATLGDLGVDGGRIVGVFGTLAANIDEVRRQTAIANKEYLANTSVAKEVQIRSESLGAVLDQLKKDFRGIWANNEVKEGVKSIVKGFADLVRVIKENATFIAYLTGNLAKAVLIWLAYKTAIIASNFALKEGTFIARAFSVVGGLLSGNLTKATASFRSLTAAMRANPFGLIVTAVFALDGALKTLYRNTERQLELEKARKETLRSTRRLTDELEASQRVMNNALERFNLLSEKERENALALADAQIGRLAAKISELEEQRDKIGNLANDPTFGQRIANTLNPFGGSAAFKNAKDALENSKEATKELDEQIEQLTTNINKLSDSRNKLYKNQFAETYADEIAGKTINQLTEKISLYEQALNLATVGSNDFIRITEKLANTRAELKKLQDSSTLGNPEDAAKAAEKIKKIEAARYKHAIDKLKEYVSLGDGLWKEVLSTKTKNDQDIIDAEEQKWQELIYLNWQSQQQLKNILESPTAKKENKAFAQSQLNDLLFQEIALKDKRDAAILAKEKELAEKRLEIRNDILDQIEDVSLSEQQKEIKRIEKHYDKIAKLADSSNNPDLAAQIEDARQLAIKQVKDKYLKLEEKEFRATQQRRNELAIEGAYALLSVFNSVGQINQFQEEAELRAYERKNEEKIASYKYLLDQNLITQDDYNSRSARLEEDLRKQEFEVRAKAAERQKLINAFSIVVDTASSIVKTGSNLGYPQAIPFQVIAGIIGAANLAAVLAEPVPQYGKGTIFSGLPHSSDPSKDGNPVIDRRTGQVLATVEAGEMLLSRAFVSNNPEISRAALRSSQVEGGRRISPEEIYGRPTRINATGFEEILSMPQYRNGKYFSDQPIEQRNLESSSHTPDYALHRKLDELIMATRDNRRVVLEKKLLEDQEDEDNFFKPFIEIQ